MYANILLSTDGSDVARKGVEHGIALAKALNARLTIITVTEALPVDYGSGHASGWIPTQEEVDSYDAACKARAGKVLDEARAMSEQIGTPAELAAKLGRTEYASEFRAVFGEHILEDPQTAYARARFALQQFQLEDKDDFAPFTSKYDYYLRGTVDLTEAEKRGLALFEDPKKGNCSACHPSKPGDDGTPPLFTDFTYDNIGVPRNRAIAANADHGYFDLGLCGPFRTDLAQRKELCGAFKVPTLRNSAVTAPYLHNGRFATLREVVEFYVARDTDPQKWYAADGKQPRKFDDLPKLYVANVNTTEVPYDRHPGDTPALSAHEIDDVVAFLQALTDGYQP